MENTFYDLNALPEGVFYNKNQDSITFGYKKFSKLVFLLIPFTILWGGVSITRIFLPQFSEKDFELTKTLFGIPFLIGTLFLIATIARMLFGKVQFKVEANGGIYSKGIFFKGRIIKFTWDNVRFEKNTESSMLNINEVFINNIRIIDLSLQFSEKSKCVYWLFRQEYEKNKLNKD
jgi:hypothetical protein